VRVDTGKWPTEALAITEADKMSLRHWVVAYSKEQVLFQPFLEPAWKPEPLPQKRPKSFWKHVFFLPE
jgi:hypothetical protein